MPYSVLDDDGPGRSRHRMNSMRHVFGDVGLLHYTWIAHRLKQIAIPGTNRIHFIRKTPLKDPPSLFSLLVPGNGILKTHLCLCTGSWNCSAKLVHKQFERSLRIFSALLEEPGNRKLATLECRNFVQICVSCQHVTPDMDCGMSENFKQGH